MTDVTAITVNRCALSERGFGAFIVLNGSFPPNGQEQVSLGRKMFEVMAELTVGFHLLVSAGKPGRLTRWRICESG